MTVIQRTQQHLKQSFGTEPTPQGAVVFYLKEVIADEVRRLASQLLIAIALAGFGAAMGWAALSPIVAIITTVVVLKFFATKSEILKCSSLITVEDMPRWLLYDAESNALVREKLAELGFRQGGIYPWQMSIFKNWEDDRRKENLKTAIQRAESTRQIERPIMQ